MSSLCISSLTTALDDDWSADCLVPPTPVARVRRRPGTCRRCAPSRNRTGSSQQGLMVYGDWTTITSSRSCGAQASSRVSPRRPHQARSVHSDLPLTHPPKLIGPISRRCPDAGMLLSHASPSVRSQAPPAKVDPRPGHPRAVWRRLHVLCLHPLHQLCQSSFPS